LAIRELVSSGLRVTFANSKLTYNPDKQPLNGLEFINTPELIVSAQIERVI
jgi:hypothetical protein